MAEKNGEQKVYSMRTMTGDMDSQKRGAAPSNIPVKTEIKEAPKKEDSKQKPQTPDQTPNPAKNQQQKPVFQTPADGEAKIAEQKNKTSDFFVPPSTKTKINKPEKPPKRPKEEIKKDLPAKKTNRKLITLIVIAVLIVSVIGFEVWWLFIRQGEESVAPVQTAEDLLPAPENTLPEQPEQEEVAEIAPETPETEEYLDYSTTEEVVLASATPNEISSAVTERASSGYTPGSLVLLNVFVNEDDVVRPVSLSELSSALKISFDSGVRSLLSGDYNLFVFQPTTFDRSTCATAGNADPECYGPRLGLAIKQSPGSDLRSSLSSWEPFMAQNLRGLILAQSTIGPGEFLLNSGTYKNVPIRYRNFPIDTITIDYANTRDLLVITTSKSSMFASIDALR